MDANILEENAKIAELEQAKIIIGNELLRVKLKVDEVAQRLAAEEKYYNLLKKKVDNAISLYEIIRLKETLLGRGFLEIKE